MINSDQSESDQQDAFHKKFVKTLKIAQGTYGIVWKARNSQTGQQVAIKKFKNLGHQGLPVSAVREIHILNKLKTSYTPQIIQLNVTVKSIQMVSQWKQLTLLKLIRHPPTQQLNHKLQVKTIFKQLVRAVDSIHNNFILHRDLKPANVMLDNMKGDNLKIIDFGMAKEIKWNKNMKMTNEVGTLYYRAPELLNGCTKYSKEIDVWAIGCIFYEILTKKIMFKCENQLLQLIKIYQQIGTEEEEAKLKLSNHSIQALVFNRSNWSNIKLQIQNLKLNDDGQDNKQKQKQLIKEQKEVNSQKQQIQKKKVLNLLQKILKIDPTKRLSCKQILEDEYFIQ